MSKTIKCVIADDEPLSLEYLQKVIDWDKYGFKICGSASDGRSALEMIRSINPDVVLIDINMPGIDGLEILKILKDENKYPPYCIVISGYQKFEFAQKAIRLSVTDYLVKPFSRDDIINCIFPISNEILHDDSENCNTKNSYDSNSVYSAYINRSITNRSRSLLKKTLIFLYEHYSENITLDMLAKELYVSPSYIRKVFRNEMHSTYNTVLENIRLEKACALLEENVFYVSNIAEMVGYQSQSYFTKVFKKKYGLTPSQFSIKE